MSDIVWVLIHTIHHQVASIALAELATKPKTVEIVTTVYPAINIPTYLLSLERRGRTHARRRCHRRLRTLHRKLVSLLLLECLAQWWLQVSSALVSFLLRSCTRCTRTKSYTLKLLKISSNSESSHRSAGSCWHSRLLPLVWTNQLTHGWLS